MSEQIRNRRVQEGAPAVPYRREAGAEAAMYSAETPKKQRRKKGLGKCLWTCIERTVVILILLAAIVVGVFLVTHRSRLTVTPNGDGTCTVTGWMGYDTFVSVWDEMEVTAIGENAFSNPLRHILDEFGRGLEIVSLPSSVTTIEKRAFSGCDYLKEVRMHKSLVSIGDAAFSGCDSLERIELPEGLATLGWGVFYDCKNLSSVLIPASVTSIGEDAFKGCAFDLTLYVYRGSYAEEYAVANGINYTYID